MGVGSLLLAAAGAAAPTLYWDVNDATAGSGNAGGTWESNSWTTDATGSTATSAWVDGAVTVFSAGTDGTGGWTVNLTSAVSTPSITFAQAGTKTIAAGGTINIGGGTLNSTALGFTPGNGDDININSALAGAGGLTIAAHGDATSNSGGGGGAEFRLGGTNTFSGGLTITSGLVSWANEANLGDASNVITLNGGGLLYTAASGTTAHNIEVGAAGGTIRTYGSTTLTLNGTIANAAGVASTTLRRTDGGTLVIKTQGTGFTGTFINGGGSTQLNALNADWSTTDFVVDGGNLMPNGGGTAVVNSINSTADVIINNGTTVDVDTGAITMRTAHWYKTTAGALGMLTSSSGTLTITNGAATGDLTTTDHQIQVPIVDSGATPVALVKNNNNSLVLAQPGTYSGGTTINGGRVQANVGTAFGTGTVTVNSAGQAWLTAIDVPYSNSFTINGNGPTEGATAYGALRFSNDATVTGTVNVASASRVAASGAGDIGTIAGLLTGSAALEKTGSGTVAISGDASGYTSTATASAGTLVIGNSFGGSVAVATGATLVNNGTIASGYTHTTGIVQGTGSFGGAVTLNGATAADVLNIVPGALTANGNLTLSGVTTVRANGLSGTVPVINYTGTLAGGTGNLALENAASFRAGTAFDATTTGVVKLAIVTDSLTWRGDDATNPTFWDTNTTANWAGTTNPDKFYVGDNVLFDDTGVSKTVRLQDNVLLSPATVTFNNSTGNDYTINGDSGDGFTGATSIVKNGTGTVTLFGYSHNYTGTVTVNDGILMAGGYEMLGNASAVTINDGGQLDINGKNLGSGTRHYNMTIAGAGDNGLGAITNSTSGSPNENAGILNLTLGGNASVGGNGGRFDIGKSGGLFGTVTGNGNTLTKVGTNMVNVRAPASDITYVVDAGTLRFENFASAAGTNAITVNNTGRVEGYGLLTFSNAVNLAAGTTLGSGGGAMQTWTGPINLSGAGTVNLRADNQAITLSGVISGDSSVSATGNNILYLTGTGSNTYTGTTTIASTGQLVLAKTGGAVAVPGDLYMAATGTRAIVSTIQDNQFGPASVIRFTGSADTRWELKGTTQTVAGLDRTTTATGYNAIQHSEFGSPAAVDGVSDLILNVADGNSFSYNGVLRDQGGRVNLTKNGTGSQTLVGTLIDYGGSTVVNAGRLVINSDDTHTSGVALAAGAVYEVNITSTTEAFENRQAYTLTGTGTYVKSGPGAMSMGWSPGASVAMSPGGLIDIQGGTRIRLVDHLGLQQGRHDHRLRGRPRPVGQQQHRRVRRFPQRRGIRHPDQKRDRLHHRRRGRWRRPLLRLHQQRHRGDPPQQGRRRHPDALRGIHVHRDDDRAGRHPEVVQRARHPEQRPATADRRPGVRFRGRNECIHHRWLERNSRRHGPRPAE